MYFNFEDFGGRENGKRFTFFSRTVEIDGQKVTHTDKSVYGALSEGIKTGENNGSPIWENDYWQVVFRGEKAYEKALKLEDKDRIVLVEFNIRNKYYPTTKKSYPQITIFDFDMYNKEETSDTTEKGAPTKKGKSKSHGDEFMNIPDDIDKDLPFR